MDPKMTGLNEPAFIFVLLILIAVLSNMLGRYFGHDRDISHQNVWMVMIGCLISVNIVYYVARWLMAGFGLPIDTNIDLVVPPIRIWAYLAETFFFCFVFYLSFERAKKVEILREEEKKKAAEVTT